VGQRTLVLVNDRVEVALALAHRGLAGVHLGQDDLPPSEARALLGPAALIGWSTHSPAQVALAEDMPVDYLGYGPIFASATKGVRAGQGAQAAWIAQAGARVPVFPIGGIDGINAAELAPVGRAAVSRAILADADPARAAREIALQLQVERD
jgi:thiamine-phosphate pyrophosphorylase